MFLSVALQVAVSSFPKVLDGESGERVSDSNGEVLSNALEVSFGFSVIAFVLGPDKGMLVSDIASILLGCFAFASD